MKQGQRLWTRDEIMLALNLYSKLPFGKMYKNNVLVKEWAVLLNRTPDAVARKLGNLASFDPTLRARGIKGLSNTAKLDQIMWDEFYNDWDNYFLASEKMLANLKHTTVEVLNNIQTDDLPKEGKEKERIVRVRVNQSLFRTIVLSNYNGKCCITGISNLELIVASHIVPWSIDHKNRLNPANGLALNALHDKAFENGLITITEDYKIKISSIFLKQKELSSIQENFINYNDKEIYFPRKLRPDIDFLKKHHVRFRE